MSDFFESEAKETEGEGEEMEEEVAIHKKKVKAIQIDDEDEEENEDERQAVDDLIDNDSIEDNDDESKKRRNSDDDEDYLPDRLDDDDYDLIEENIGVKVRRTRTFKRLRKIEDEESDEESQEDQGDDRESIARKLFDGSDDEDESRDEPVREERQYGSEESDADSEADYFIVDHEGRPVNEGLTKQKPIFNDANMQRARDIFGEGFDYGDLEEDGAGEEDQRTARRQKKQSRRSQDIKPIYEVYEPHELEQAGFTDESFKIKNQDIPERMQQRSVPVSRADDEELDEESEWIFKLAFSERVVKKSQTQSPVTFGVAAPDWDEHWDRQTTVAPAASSIVSGGGRGNFGEDEDDWDRPAVPQTVSAPIPRPATTAVEDDWDEEDWSAKSKNPSDKTEPAKPAEEPKSPVIAKIRKALEFMRNQLLEVPFIAFYRKEYVQPELSINDLWTVYRLDARFCQLKQRKGRLAELFKNMRAHQMELISKLDDPTSHTMRSITDADLEEIKAITSSDELKDMNLLFSLYFSDEVPAMKEKLEEEQQLVKTAAAVMTTVNEVGKGTENPVPHKGAPKNVKKDVIPKKCRVRRRSGCGPYGAYKKQGVESFVRKFGLSSREFAENLRENHQFHEVEQYCVDPLEAAKEICSELLKEPEKVIKGAKFMMATQISREPVVRKCVRQVFFERATITCVPTKKGLTEIDEDHPCFTMKYIKDKPVGALKADQFMKLHLAEQDGLLTITLGDVIKGSTEPKYIDEVKALFMKDEFSKNVQDWNTLRGECIESAFEELLFPELRKELRAKLLETAKEHILKTCSNKLYNYLKIAPYKVNFANEDEEWDSKKGIRILAIAYDPDYAELAFACLVNSDGEPAENLRLKNIFKNKNSCYETDRLGKESDLEAIKILISSAKPHLIVIGGESREAIMIQQELKAVVEELAIQEAFPSINVEIVDNQLAKVYASSTQSSTDFRGYTELLKQAVSLGRRMQDPLMEFSQLCNADEDILCLKFHPLQDHVPKEELLEHLYLEFVNRTNEVGVDVNRAIDSSYASKLIQFTSGLGPLKAAGMLNLLRQKNRRLENRNQLKTTCHVGLKVFTNCAGFIKIDTNSISDTTESYVEVLDGTRVHPEAYEWARKMAADALEYEDDDSLDFSHGSAVEEVMRCPEKLQDLDLDAFAAELEKQDFGKKSIALYDIRAELTHPYRDLRVHYESLSDDELFNLLTKESPDTLYVGKLITATVTGFSYKKPEGETLDKAIPIRNELTGMWQCAFCGEKDLRNLSEVWHHFDSGACPGQVTGVRLRLDNGMSGFIPISKLSDNPTLNPADRVQRNQTVYCRIVKIDVTRYSVECTSRSSDLSNVDGEWAQEKDEHYDEGMDHNNKKAADESQKKTQPLDKIVLSHPNFRELGYKQAEMLLETKHQGDAVVRPSSKGKGHFTITWKVAEGAYQHIDVREVETKKGNGSITEKSYWLGEKEFESIDEILGRHVAPMAAYARDIISYKYYVKGIGGDAFKVDHLLLTEKAMNPNKIHYVLHVSPDYPGKFAISYLPRHITRHEYITVTPTGYRFRYKHFDTFDTLLVWFKDHSRDAPPPVAST